MSNVTAVLVTKFGCTVEPCGSRVTCDPPPTDTDQDFLVCMPYKMQVVTDLVAYLHDSGFRWEGSEHYQDAAQTFMSWRCGEQNLIITTSEDFASKHRTATALCTRLNLLNKADRISLFQAVLYGVIHDGLPVGSKPKAVAPAEEIAF